LQEISVSEQSDRPEFEELERVNAELKASLKNCRAILRDCHDRLAANSNDVQGASDEAEGQSKPTS
jgi:hypothetical protein